ncbi:MAG: hypothetical protein ABI740_10105 [Alphaproteobacteria bacterium]
MPLHAQIICIGGNLLLGVLMLIAASQSFATGDLGLTIFMALLGCACGYTAWVLLKFRHYLGEEATQERQAHLAFLRQELAKKTAQTSAASETTPDMPIH